MARGHDRYSKTVAWLKILLPMLALVVLATVFLLTGEEGFEAGFGFSQADIDTLESGSFLRRTQIDGVTTKGEAFLLVAERIAPKPDDRNQVVVSAFSGRFTLAGGEELRLQAKTALLDITAQTVLLETGGRVMTPDGNLAEVERMLIRLETGEMSGRGIVADGPLGRISADRFRIVSDEDENRVLWFENNVRMTYALENEGG